jgi:hypothetical protein
VLINHRDDTAASDLILPTLEEFKFSRHGIYDSPFAISNSFLLICFYSFISSYMNVVPDFPQ